MGAIEMNENWTSLAKNFFTKAEKIEILEQYKQTLEEEAGKISSIIQQLERNN